MPAPLRLRLDERSGLHVLSPSRGSGAVSPPPCIDHFDAAGVWKGRTPLPGPVSEGERRAIVDYAVDAHHRILLLERVSLASPAGTAHLNVLSRYGASSELLWRRQGPVVAAMSDVEVLGGDLLRVSGHPPSSFHLTGRSTAHRVGLFDANDGAWIRTLELAAGVDQQVFATPSGQLVSSFLQEDSGLPAVVVAPPGGDGSVHPIAGDEAYGLVQFAFAVDERRNFYAAMPAGVFPRAGIARLSFEGEAVLHAEFDQIVVGESNRIVHLASVREGQMHIRSWWPDGRSRMLALERPGGGGDDAMSQVLSAVDASGRFIIHRGEGPGTVGELAFHLPDGRLESVQVPDPGQLARASLMSPAKDWVVDGNGAILVPVADADAFRIVRFQADPR